MSEDQHDLSGFDEAVALLRSLSAPAHANTPQGRAAKRLMLSDMGAQLRRAVPALRPMCKEFPANLIILSDGGISTCCQDSLGRNAFASIYDEDLETIWRKRVRSLLNDGDGLYTLNLCRECIGSETAPLVPAPAEAQAWRATTENYPQDVTIEVMGACNYACCVSRDIHRHRAVKPDLDRVFKGIESMLPGIGRLRLFNFGEPLMNDGFKEFIRRCREAAPDVVMTLATNGLLMDEEYSRCFIDNRVDHVVVSTHGGPGTENMLRYSRQGADYPRVLANVERLLAMRREAGKEFPKVSLRAILFDWNDTDEVMDRFRTDAARMGLKPEGGNINLDNYHWLLDGNHGGGPISSKRFTIGSKDFDWLVARGETVPLCNRYCPPEE